MDIIPVLERFAVQPIDVVYPSDYYLLRDSANAVRRSIHVYDVVPAIDYASVAKAGLVHALDVVRPYELSYTTRQNVVHVYDVVAQPDSVAKSGQVTISVRDILTIPGWFFRVNKALKILEVFTLYEQATAFNAPTIYVEDYSIIYDLRASLNAVKAMSALDKLITDGASYTKSYSPQFFALLQRRTPIRYITLNVSDYIPVLDSAAYSKSYSPLLFSMLSRRMPIRYLTLSVSDGVAVSDSVSTVKTKVVSVSDIVSVADYVAVRNIAVYAYDYIIRDYVAEVAPNNVRYISLYANVGMRSISVFEKVVPYESVWVGPRVITIHARDYLVSDSATVVKKSVRAYDVVAIVENVNIVRR